MSIVQRVAGIVTTPLVLLLLPLAGCASSSHGSSAAQGSAFVAAGGRLTMSLPSPPREFAGRQMRPRPGAVPPGTLVGSTNLWTDRVFSNAVDGFALANVDSAQYPARTIDGGQVWRIDGPQLHIDAADGAEGVGYVGVVTARTFFAYGSSVIGVTTNAGRTWWETFLGELVVAVVPGSRNALVAYVQQQVNNSSTTNRALTWQYISRDGGRRWSYSASLGGLPSQDRWASSVCAAGRQARSCSS